MVQNWTTTVKQGASALSRGLLSITIAVVFVSIISINKPNIHHVIVSPLFQIFEQDYSSPIPKSGPLKTHCFDHTPRYSQKYIRISIFRPQ